jgi:hypothetical protein
MGHVALEILEVDRAAYPGFDEGYGDTYSFMVNDNSVFGPSQFINGDNMRDDPTSSNVNCQYPLTYSGNQTLVCNCSEGHLSGPLLSGPWVRIKTALKSYYGSTTGLQYARELFGSWSLVTMGGDDSVCHSAFPGTLLEVWDLASAGVQRDIVCAAFLSHSIHHTVCDSD